MSSAGDLDRAEKAAMEQIAGRDDVRGDVRSVHGRLFRLQDGVWTDVAHDSSSSLTRLKAFSAAYFDVLAALPELAPVLAELGDVVVAGAEASVGVDDRGIEQISTSDLRRLVTTFRGVAG